MSLKVKSINVGAGNSSNNVCAERDDPVKGLTVQSRFKQCMANKYKGTRILFFNK